MNINTVPFSINNFIACSSSEDVGEPQPIQVKTKFNAHIQHRIKLNIKCRRGGFRKARLVTSIN